MRRDLTKLHLIVFLWGLTGIFGKLIDLPSPELVFYRTAIAAIGIAVVMKCRRQRFEMRRMEVITVIGIGVLMGTHWMLFFGAVHVSNVSVAMVGFATLSLWTALLEPLMIRERKLKRYELILSGVAFAAMVLIFWVQSDQWLGLVLALGCAIFGSLFSILTGVFARKRDHHEISFYEMIGGVLVCGTVALLAEIWHPDGTVFAMPESGSDILFLLLLALLCTVYAFSESVELLKRIPVFTICLTNNLEPIYGIVLAAILFKDYEHVSTGFYLGTALILASVFMYPFLVRADRETHFTKSSH